MQRARVLAAGGELGDAFAQPAERRAIPEVAGGLSENQTKGNRD